MEQSRVIEKVFLVEEDDFAYSFYKLLEPVVLDSLKAFRALKEEKRAAEKALADLQARRTWASNRIQQLNVLIPQLEGRRSTSSLIGLAILIFSLILATVSSILGFFTFLLALAIFFYVYLTHTVLNSSREEASRLSVEIKQLENQIGWFRQRIRELDALISSFTLPAIKLRAYKCHVPTVVVRNPMGRERLVITPWSAGETFRVTYVTDPSRVEEARGRLALGENLYFDAALRGKDAGYKVIESFRKMNLWERILESRSPERVLREIVEESYSMLKSALESSEETLKLEPIDAESLKLLSELLIQGDGFQPLAVHERSLSIVRGEVEKLFYLVDAVRQLSELRSYVAEARELMAKREVYASIVDLAVREMIARTMPLEPELFNLFFRTLYCRRCAERLLGDYVPQLDLRRWVYSEILGGVDRDSDIAFPEEEVKDIVIKKWKELEERVYRELPLPGVTGEEPFEELRARYQAALQEYALPFTGAEERVEVHWVSAFEPPLLKCARCGRQLDSESTASIVNLRHPVIKGYAGLLAEKQRDLLDRSSEIVSSVNNARLQKDGRKTTVGIYKQIVQSVEQEILKLEADIREAEAHKRNLQKILVPLVAAPAAQILISELTEREELREQLQKISGLVGGEI